MRALLVVADLMTRSRLQGAAVAAGYDVTVLRQVPPPPAGGAEEAPDIMVVDLDLPGALEAVTAWLGGPDRGVGTRVVGFAFHVEEELIGRARAAGVEVFPHGATARPARLFT